MHRSLAVVLCILITCASSVAQFGIGDCKSGTFHGCSSGITNFPDPTGAWVTFDYTSCQTSGGRSQDGKLPMIPRALNIGSTVLATDTKRPFAMTAFKILLQLRICVMPVDSRLVSCRRGPYPVHRVGRPSRREPA